MTYGTHLRRSRHGTLYFRYVIPLDVRAALGGSELSVSLGTSSKRGAELAALELELTAKRFVDAAREAIRMNKPIKPDLAALQAVIRAQQRRALLGEIDELEQIKADQANHIEVLTSKLISRIELPPTPTLPFKAANPSLAEAVGAFQAERQATENWTPKTATMWDSRLRLLLDWFDEMPVSDLSREEMMGFFRGLKTLPKNASKYKALNGLTMRALVEVEGFDRISSSTVNQIMQCMSALFAWMETDRAKWGITGNVAKGLKLSNTSEVKRVAFSPDDLRAMFSALEWQKRTFLHSYAYWLLPLALFTGARINELCQIDLKDFSEKDGHPVISLCTEGLKGKNKNARRSVPVHPELVRLGLLRHVDLLRTSGNRKLFPECIEKRDGHGQDASRWFGKFKTRAGIVDPRKVFHSTRHSFTSQLLDAGVDEATGVAPLVGHAGGGESSSTYWNEKDIRRFVDFVKLVTYPVISELVPVVEDVCFGTDVHRGARRPPPRKQAAPARKRVAPPIR